jgi:hypothetical protein
MSREFAELVTDPEGTAWTSEIGGLCDANVLRDPVYTVNLGVSPFIVQKLWSNATSSCVSSLPTIINLFPDSGPNNGGNGPDGGEPPVTVQGGGLFNPSGESQFFNGLPASGVSCMHDGTSCAVTAPDSHGAPAGTITVTANVGGFESNDQPPSCPTNLPGITCSGWTGPVFTYEAPPPCKSELSCQGHLYGFPSLNVTCPGNVDFFTFGGAPDQAFVVNGQNYSFPVDQVEEKVAACSPVGYSSSWAGCSYYEASEPDPNYCGKMYLPPGYCAACAQHGGHCATFPGATVCVLLGPLQPLPNK